MIHPIFINLSRRCIIPILAKTRVSMAAITRASNVCFFFNKIKIKLINSILKIFSDQNPQYIMQEGAHQSSMMGYQQGQTHEMMYNPEMSIESAASQVPPLFPVGPKL